MVTCVFSYVLSLKIVQGKFGAFAEAKEEKKKKKKDQSAWFVTTPAIHRDARAPMKCRHTKAATTKEPLLLILTRQDRCAIPAIYPCSRQRGCDLSAQRTLLAPPAKPSEKGIGASCIPERNPPGVAVIELRRAADRLPVYYILCTSRLWQTCSYFRLCNL